MKEIALLPLLIAAGGSGFATPEQEACAATFHTESNMSDPARFSFEQSHRHVTLTVSDTVLECYFRELDAAVPELERFTFSLGGRPAVEFLVEDLNRKIWQHFHPASPMN